MIRRIAVSLLVASALVRCSPSSSSSSSGPTDDGGVGPSADGAGGEAGTDASPEASCSANVDIDPKNCGRCGHDCLGGGCVLGLCQPVVLAANRGGPGAIAMDATHIYWVEAPGSAIARVPKVGGDVEVLSNIVGNVGAGHLRVDDTRAYWSDCYTQSNSFLMRRNSVPKVPDAGAAILYGTNVLVSGAGGTPTYLFGMALYGDTVLATLGGSVNVFPKDSNIATGGFNTAYPMTCLAADDAGVYAGSFDGELLAISLEAGTATPLVTGQGDVEELMIDGEDLFWIAKGQGAIGIAKKRTSPEVFAAALDDPGGIAIEPTSVYWTERNTVRSCPRSGCGAGPRTIAKAQPRPMGIAVDDTNLYWANAAGGTIVRLAK